MSGVPLQLPNPLDNYTKMMTLRHLIDQGQMNQLQMQEAKRKLEAERIMAQAYGQSYRPPQAGQPAQPAQEGPLPSGGNLGSLFPATHAIPASPGGLDTNSLMSYIGQSGRADLIPTVQAQQLKLQQDRLALDKTQEETDKLGHENFKTAFNVIAANPTRQTALNVLNEQLKQARTPAVANNIFQVMSNIPQNDADIPKWTQSILTNAEQRMTNAATLRGQDMGEAEKITQVPDASSPTGYRNVTTIKAGQGMPASPPVGGAGSPHSLEIARNSFTKDMKPLEDMGLQIRQLEGLLTQPQTPERDLAIRNAMGELTRAGRQGESSVSQWKNVGSLYRKLIGTASNLTSGENLEPQIKGIAEVVRTMHQQVLNPLIQDTTKYHSEMAPKYGWTPRDVIGGWQSNVLAPAAPSRPPLDSFRGKNNVGSPG